MQYLKDTGFVIKRINIGEADRYLTIFTENNGKVEVVAKGVRKITSKRSSHIELFNLVRFQAVRTSKNFVLTEVEVINSFENKKQDLEKISTIFLICELVEKLCPHGQTHKDIYQLMLAMVESLSLENLSEDLFEFQVQLLTLLGFWNNEKKFQNSDDLKNFIESILERKIKSHAFLTKLS